MAGRLAQVGGALVSDKARMPTARRRPEPFLRNRDRIAIAVSAISAKHRHWDPPASASADRLEIHFRLARNRWTPIRGRRQSPARIAALKVIRFLGLLACQVGAGGRAAAPNGAPPPFSSALSAPALTSPSRARSTRHARRQCRRIRGARLLSAHPARAAAIGTGSSVPRRYQVNTSRSATGNSPPRARSVMTSTCPDAGHPLYFVICTHDIKSERIALTAIRLAPDKTERHLGL